MKKSVMVSVDSEKISALEMYLMQKSMSLTDELNKCIDSLYMKNVPQNVRDFIENKSAAKSGRKPKKSMDAISENEFGQ